MQFLESLRGAETVMNFHVDVAPQVHMQLCNIQASGLVSVCLNYASVGPRDVEALSFALSASRTLQYLDLSSANVGALTACLLLPSPARCGVVRFVRS
jgi:hypothetical protein